MLHLEGGTLDVVHDPKRDRVYVDGDGVLGEARLGAEIGGADALVDVIGHAIQDRNDEEQPRAAQSAVLAHSEHHGLFPLIGKLYG